MKKRIIAAALAALTVFSSAATVVSYAEGTFKVGSATVDRARNEAAVSRLSAQAKGRVSDVFAIAKTQNGYVGKIVNKGKKNEKRYSWFADGSWNPKLAASNRKNTGNWCSEFAYWCLYNAKVPGITKDSLLNDVESYRDSKAFRIYKFRASAENSSKNVHPISQSKIVKNWFGSRYKKAPVLRISGLKKGDVLQICADRKKSKTAPHHTALFDHSKGNTIYVVEGNVEATSSKSRVNGGADGKSYGSYAAHEVIAVLRPNYR